jgi:hypothetical protein|tara:strand:- start:4129 stop:4383 length:255 start_codon:yes stop_codon:yes gene_type:complete
MALTRRKSALVRAHLARSRKSNHDAQSYGGSTGGRKSLDSNTGIKLLNQRSAQQAEDNQLFKEDLDKYGARKAMFEARYGDLGT